MRGTKALAVVFALLASLGVARPGTAARYQERTEKLAPGVKYTVIRDPAGPWRIRIVSIKLNRPSTLDVALAQDQLPGFETTSSMADRHGALVAINGDYARSSGRPVFTFAEDGDLSQTELTFGRNFAVSADEATAFMGHPEVRAVARDPNTGGEFVLEQVNAGAPEFDDVAAFTARGSWEEKPPPFSCSARLRPGEQFHINASTASSEASHTVEAVRCGDNPMGRRGATVIATPVTGTQAPALGALQPGQEMIMNWTLGWANVLDTIGGNPTLLENGFAPPENVNGSGRFFARHPRTGVGMTADGKALFVVVDGRQPRYSVGMTLREFSDLFASLGATWALNLDGGGSSTMVINDEVVNRPSDEDGERAVSSALLLLPGEDFEEYQGPEPGPLPLPTPTIDPQQVWARMIADGGSIGGLAEYLNLDLDR